MAQSLVLPGTDILSSSLPKPTNASLPLKIGPGLRHVPPGTICSIMAGSLCTDNRTNTTWIEHLGGRYLPQVNDVVLATVHHSSTDFYHCALTPYTTLAQLPQLAFEGATKKTRPQLNHGSLVYARVISASKHLDPEVVCYNPSTGKSEGMGELKGGMLFDISLGMARRLLMNKQKEDGGLLVLDECAEKLPFEVAIGRNGRIWVNSAAIKETLLVGKALQETDKLNLGLEQQKKLVRRLLKGI